MYFHYRSWSHAARKEDEPRSERKTERDAGTDQLHFEHTQCVRNTNKSTPKEHVLTVFVHFWLVIFMTRTTSSRNRKTLNLDVKELPTSKSNTDGDMLFNALAICAATSKQTHLTCHTTWRYCSIADALWAIQMHCLLPSKAQDVSSDGFSTHCLVHTCWAMEIVLCTGRYFICSTMQKREANPKSYHIFCAKIFISAIWLRQRLAVNQF